MSQEDKQLLLADLCARLPYGVKLNFYAAATKENYTCTLLGIEPNDDKSIIAKVDSGAFMFPAEHIKPYLRPISSMINEERRELCNIRPCYINSDDIVNSTQCNTFMQASECQDWLNAHHFDYRGLIEKRLAIAVTEKNNPYKS